MAGKKGRNASFKLDVLGGALTDISRYLKKVSRSYPTEMLETTTFQSPGGHKEKIPGVSDFKLDIEGNAEAAIATHLMALRGQDCPTGGTEGEGFDFEDGPEGTATGKRKFTGKVFLASYSEETDVNGVNTFSATLEGHGGVTVGTFA